MKNHGMCLQRNDTELELGIGYKSNSFFKKSLRKIWQTIFTSEYADELPC